MSTAPAAAAVEGAASPPGTSMGSRLTAKASWVGTVICCDERASPGASISRTYWPAGTCSRANVPSALERAVRSADAGGIRIPGIGVEGGATSEMSASGMGAPCRLVTRPFTDEV